MWTLRGWARRRYRQLARTEETEILEIPLQVAGRTTWAFMLIASACAGLATARLGVGTEAIVEKILTIAFFWQGGVWASTAAAAWLDHRQRIMLEADKAAAGSIGVIRFVARVSIWAMVLLLTLDNLGIDITALVAGLGIGGIAIALAVQKVLGDLLASLSIALDKPFLIGDFVVVGEHMGTVEYIGIKSTRLRSLSGEQIVMSNADLLGGRLRNYGRMQERRVAFTVGVAYETPREKLLEIPRLLRKAIAEQGAVRFDRAHFAGFGSYSLDFECVYYVLSADYTRYMDVQQAINFRILEEFEKLAVDFAYPTQVLWMRQASC
ncbi:MAG: mechanosensitive ion channel family protein [Gammaproteobacteria bacterium]|nr:mechanosensitive ion channel family protein [Gammaproteobacteria bacterium]